MSKEIEWTSEMKYIFITMMHAALKWRDMKMNQEMFLEFANGVWDSMLINDEDEIRETMKNIMQKEINSCKDMKDNDKCQKK